MIALLWLPRYLSHPLSGIGAAFWGGIGGYLTVAAAVILHAASSYRKHQCHVRWCPWPSWHPDPATGHPVCRLHHPDGDGIASPR